MPSARSISLDVLDRVFFDGAYSHIALSAALDDGELSDRDRGLSTELVYGTLARKRTIDAILSEFVNRSLDGLDRPVLISLRMAVYQLVFLDRIPAHAAVDEAVELSKKHCGQGAAGFTNGVLRSLLRKEEKWTIWDNVDAEENPVEYLGLRHSLPDWIASQLIERHGFKKAMDIAEAYNGRPPLYFRALKELSDAVEEQLEPVQSVPGAYRSDSMSPALLRAVREHRLVVQDLGSQLVGYFASPSTTERILDACAGLGGKTLHLAQLAGDDATVVAVEPHQSKLDQLAETLGDLSLGERIEPFHGELTKLPADSAKFDLVLVDAPCSGLGVIRRHPETRWRRDKSDVANRARLQSELLNQAARHVAPGGLLVYSVCSFANREGPARIAEFLNEHSHFERASAPSGDDIDWSQFADEAGDLHLNPLDHNTDGFYAARLQRKSEPEPK